MSAWLAMVRLEIARGLRRRETLLAGTALVALVGLAVPVVTLLGVRLPDLASGPSDQALSRAAGVARNVARLAGAALLWVTTFLLGYGSVREEQRTATLDVLVQSPLGRLRVIGGKLVGQGAVAIALASLVTTATLAARPLLFEPAGAWLGAWVVVALVAFGAAAQGVVTASLERHQKRRYVVSRLLVVAHWIAPVVVCSWFLAADVRAAGFGLFDVAVNRLLGELRDVAYPIAAIPHPRLALAAALASQAAAVVVHLLWNLTGVGHRADRAAG